MAVMSVVVAMGVDMLHLLMLVEMKMFFPKQETDAQAHRSHGECLDSLQTFS